MSNKNNPKLALHILIAVLLTFGLTVSLQSILADWSAPTAAPPGDNIPKPIFSSSAVAQTIQGGHSLAVTGPIIATRGVFNSWISNDGDDEGISIDTSGNVGIGTASPSPYKLNVLGNTNVTGNLTVSGTISKIGTLINNNWCRTNGTQIICDQATPSFTETDPKVGSVSNGYWCRGNGTQIVCDQATPSFTESDPYVSSWMKTGVCPCGTCGAASDNGGCSPCNGCGAEICFNYVCTPWGKVLTNYRVIECHCGN